jgi:hypothetical protein
MPGDRAMTFAITILLFALVALAIAWAINALVGILSGDDPGSLFSEWWQIFFNMGRSPAAYAERPPEIFGGGKFSVGDKVRVTLLPPDLERSMPDDRRELFRRCAGKVLRVEGVDEFGGIELHVLDDGSQSPDRCHHVLFIEPQYVERVSEDI